MSISRDPFNLALSSVKGFQWVVVPKIKNMNFKLSKQLTNTPYLQEIIQRIQQDLKFFLTWNLLV